MADKNKDALHGDIMVGTMITSSVAAIVGTATNILDVTDIPWWIIGVIGAPFALIILVVVLGIIAFIWQMNRHG